MQLCVSLATWLLARTAKSKSHRCLKTPSFAFQDSIADSKVFQRPLGISIRHIKVFNWHTFSTDLLPRFLQDYISNLTHCSPIFKYAPTVHCCPLPVVQKYFLWISLIGEGEDKSCSFKNNKPGKRRENLKSLVVKGQGKEGFISNCRHRNLV